MSPNERLLVQYVLAATQNQKCQSINLTADKLNYLYTQGSRHQVQTLIFSALNNLKALQETAPDLIKKWTQETIMRSCYQKEHVKQIAYILGEFEKQDIAVLSLKGLFLRNLYPKPDLRLMGDADILIHKADMDKVKKSLESQGYQEVEDTHAYHVVFTHPRYMCIEVHWALTNHNSFNVPAVIAFEEQVWEHAAIERIGDSSVLTLSIDDHLIYLCIHMAKHLNYAGFGLRQLCDFYLLLKKYNDKFNWPRLTQRLMDIGLYEFFAMQIAVCEIFFDYKRPAALVDLTQYATPKINLFINDLFQSGVFGMSTYYRSLAVTFTNGKETHIPYTTSMWQIFFPKYTKLKVDYSYLEKKPYLIIIAWFQHLYHLIVRRDQKFITKIQALVFTKYSMHKRAQMLKTLKLSK